MINRLQSTMGYSHCMFGISQVLLIGREEYLPHMRPPLSKELWFSPEKDLVNKLKFRTWNGKERRWGSIEQRTLAQVKQKIHAFARSIFSFGHCKSCVSPSCICSIFFEKEAFYCQPSELDSKPNGGVAVALGKQVLYISFSRSLYEYTDQTLKRLRQFNFIQIFCTYWWYYLLYLDLNSTDMMFARCPSCMFSQLEVCIMCCASESVYRISTLCVSLELPSPPSFPHKFAAWNFLLNHPILGPEAFALGIKT